MEKFPAETANRKSLPMNKKEQEKVDFNLTRGLSYGFILIFTLISIFTTIVFALLAYTLIENIVLRLVFFSLPMISIWFLLKKAKAYYIRESYLKASLTSVIPIFITVIAPFIICMLLILLIYVGSPR